VLTAALIGLAALGGCAAPDATAEQNADFATETQVLEAELGGSYDLHVAPAAEVGKKGALKVLSFPITPSQPFAAVMRRADDSALDPWLALYVDGERVVVSDWDQAAVPMAAESDAVIVYTPAEGEEVLLVAGDRDMEADADFQIDLIALEGAPTTDLPFHQTNPATRVLTDALREREPQTLAYLEAGMISEGDAGMLDEHPDSAPSLKERAELRSFVSAVNDERATLFRELVRGATGAEDPALEAEAGRVCGTLWAGLRQDAHQLR